MRPATLLKKRLWHECFPVNFAKFLRKPFLQNTTGWLLLKGTVIIIIKQQEVSTSNYQVTSSFIRIFSFPLLMLTLAIIPLMCASQDMSSVSSICLLLALSKTTFILSWLLHWSKNTCESQEKMFGTFSNSQNSAKLTKYGTAQKIKFSIKGFFSKCD